VTQRPAELSVSSLSQCNTIFALRLGNENDLEFVRHAVPDSSRWLMDALPALNTREAVVVGDGVPVPMHIRFDDLVPERRPASMNPGFAAAWQRDVATPGLIARTVARWRDQARVPRPDGAGTSAGDDGQATARSETPAVSAQPGPEADGARRPNGANGHVDAEPRHERPAQQVPAPGNGAAGEGQRVTIRIQREARPAHQDQAARTEPEPAISAPAPVRPEAPRSPVQAPAPRQADANRTEPAAPSPPATGAHPLRAARRFFGRHAL
jgi:hypothetical protein